MKEEKNGNGTGCILWLILLVLTSIALMMVGFDPHVAVTYATALVSGLVCVLVFGPCSFVCVIFSVIFVILLGVVFLVEVSEDLKRWP
jgi:hypothetical protein